MSHDDYIDKVHKADYVSLQVEFADSLTQLASDLKCIVATPIEAQVIERKMFLQSALNSMNDWVDSRIRVKSLEIETASKCLFHAGLVLPLRAATSRKRLHTTKYGYSKYNSTTD